MINKNENGNGILDHTRSIRTNVANIDLDEQRSSVNGMLNHTSQCCFPIAGQWSSEKIRYKQRHWVTAILDFRSTKDRFSLINHDIVV
jgi:hypothetical protein